MDTTSNPKNKDNNDTKEFARYWPHLTPPQAQTTAENEDDDDDF